MNKIFVRIRGGIGNQLFCYAAARRLAYVNNAELILDHRTGFAKDFKYKRKFMLDSFQVPVRKIRRFELMWPFESVWLGFLKFISNHKYFSNSFYIEQKDMIFNDNLLNLQLKGNIYLDGYWQSEDYFKDIETVIRNDLKIIPPKDSINQNIVLNIKKLHSVAIHVRWFDDPGNIELHNIKVDYYNRAIEIIEHMVDNAHYFIFSDDPDAAKSKLILPENRYTYISHNKGDENAYADLWLMSKCHYFITANSTFSWWAAWLSDFENKIVLTPDFTVQGKTAWGFVGLIPKEWIKI
jgi:hypothetical protein